MAEWIEHLLLDWWTPGFNSGSGQTNDLKIGIHSFFWLTFSIMDSAKQAASSLVALLGKALNGITSSRCGRPMVGNS